MKKIPSIVKELRDAEKDEEFHKVTKPEPEKITNSSQLKKEIITTDDILDDMWFDLWRFL